MTGLEMYEIAMFGSFVAMLVGLLLFHHHKNIVVMLGLVALSVLFSSHMGGISDWLTHFNDPHRKHLLMDLALLIPAFALVAHYFEHSGASHGLARVLRRDSALLWAVFTLSIALDNIAAALIGATILLAKYGKDAPFRMIIGCIGASNLGGGRIPRGRHHHGDDVYLQRSQDHGSRAVHGVHRDHSRDVCAHIVGREAWHQTPGLWCFLWPLS